MQQVAALGFEFVDPKTCGAAFREQGEQPGSGRRFQNNIFGPECGGLSDHEKGNAGGKGTSK